MVERDCAGRPARSGRRRSRRRKKGRGVRQQPSMPTSMGSAIDIRVDADLTAWSRQPSILITRGDRQFRRQHRQQKRLRRAAARSGRRRSRRRSVIDTIGDCSWVSGPCCLVSSIAAAKERPRRSSAAGGWPSSTPAAMVDRQFRRQHRQQKLLRPCCRSRLHALLRRSARYVSPASCR